MDINKLYNKLDKIFVEHTTHKWKNGWVHEGDRLSKELTIQKEVAWNNSFLLQETYDPGLTLDGPNGFKIEVRVIDGVNIRIDIESKPGDIQFNSLS